MIEPTKFGSFLLKKRKETGLLQSQLAEAIGKTSQYIHNIEKGKNNAPPNHSDLKKLAKALRLEEKDEKLFFEKAAADRNTLPKEQIQYIYSHSGLADLIRIGAEKKISNKQWKTVLELIQKDEKGAENK